MDIQVIVGRSPALLLTRGEPVAITAVNQLKHATTVHWHGIELESYYDGVPHWNGDERPTSRSRSVKRTDRVTAATL